MPQGKGVGVIGAGLMGHGIAQIFAVRGYSVALMDVKEELLSKALEGVRSNLTLMVEHGIGSRDDIDPTLSRIKTTVNMAEAADGAQCVIEAVFENLELKQKTFKDLDALCPKETILATNTSVISISEIAEQSEQEQD